MVMDATQPQPPSPQSVGREFVRQYYTLLNKAPNHLHRFYNQQSSFVHGESTLVVGQKNIYTRIQQLNFHDCHAKISQVDAQATLGNGVVVQVTGELSNDGQPMRRFTQTFVLASQSPKKYYVHNDIFRYQDMYTDEENDVESSRSEHDVDDMDQVVSNDNQITVSSGGMLVEQQSQPPPQQQQPPPQQQQPQQPLLPQQQQQQQQLSAPVAVAAANVAATAGVLPPQQQQQQAVVVPPQQQQPIYYTMPPNTAATGRAPPPMQVLNATAPGQVAPLAGNGTPQYGAAATPGVVTPQVGGINHQLNGVAVAGSHEDILQQQQLPQSGNIVTGTGSTPIPTVLAAQNATIPVANAAAMPQNNAGQISAFQPTQSAVLSQQQVPPQQQMPLLQQPQQQPQHHQQHINNNNNVHTQQNAAQQHAATSTVNEISENVNTSFGSNAAHSAPEPTPIIVDDFKTINDQQQQEKYDAVKQQQHQLHQNEPKTYANLFKTTTSSPSGFVNAAMQQQQQYQQQQQQQHHQQQHNSNNTSTSYQGQNNNGNTSTYAQNNSNGNVNNRYNDRNNENGRMDNNSNILSGQGSLPQRQNSRMNKDFDQRRTSNSFSDNHQLFLGNIPHHASDDELKKMFQQFGNVLELRILSKPSGKMMPGVRHPPNYAFITYEDPESVQNCLAHCPIYFPENSPDGQKLNVEEKKPRSRNDLPPRQSGIGMGNNINNMNNSNQRNMSGSAGGPQSRSLSGSGNSGGLSGVMRGNNSGGGGNVGGGGANNMPRGANNSGRMGGSGYRSGASNGNSISGGGSGGGNSQIRGGSNNSSANSQQSGGGNFVNRR